ncbi:hypothetical protein [Streptomyces sp. ISL-44]|uniref:hypothetical protein n=1 Tax=Streptomyces sp. ISL-44 TaxID=2819184 RepID=UPI0020360F09|nr:hypothetical protein [Streptomyces sp. ISL-44]
MGKERRLLALVICLVLGGGLLAAVLGASRAAGPHRGAAGAHPAPSDYVDIQDVPRISEPIPAQGPDGSAGSVVMDCGRNEEGHYNEDNLVVSPGLRAGAHHTHAYVGNLSTDAMSTDASLDAAAPVAAAATGRRTTGPCCGGRTGRARARTRTRRATATPGRSCRRPRSGWSSAAVR